MEKILKQYYRVIETFSSIYTDNKYAGVIVDAGYWDTLDIVFGSCIKLKGEL